MKIFLNIIASILIVSCGPNANHISKTNDSLDFGGRSEAEVRDSLKKVIDKNLMNQYGDTTGVYKSPVKVTSAKFVEDEYSSFKDVRLTFKNVSDKKITAIRFKWIGTNAFNEPADMGGPFEGWGGGFTDEALSPGKTTSAEWSVNSRDGKKILQAFAYEVMFADDTKWELKN